MVIVDSFEDNRRSGRVVGSTSTEGSARSGRDPHRALSIAAGRLRIRSITRPGWGDTAISYGPLPVADGSAFAAVVLNGHNTSQSEPLGESLGRRIKRWIKGNEVDEPLLRMFRWVRAGRKGWTLRRFRHWTLIAAQNRAGSLATLDENLSVGFLPHPTSRDPLAEGNSFVMHATGAYNGELWIRDVGGPRRVLPSVQNVPLFLMVVARGQSVIHYVASVEGVAGMPSLPSVRPVAIVTRDQPKTSFGSIQQSVSGQIGFGVDTHVHDVRAAVLDEWLEAEARPSVTADLSALSASDVFDETLDEPPGLIRLTADPLSDFDLRWRGHDSSGLVLSVGRAEIALRALTAAGNTVLATAPRVRGTDPIDLQISDDGNLVGVHSGSELLFGDWVDAGEQADGRELSVVVGSGVLRSIESHRRTALLPKGFRPDPPPLPMAATSWVVAQDDFGAPYGDLAGRPGPDGTTWTRGADQGRFVVGPTGARADATAHEPLAGRSAYSIPNPVAGPVEIEIDVVPPGARRGDGDRGRAGVFFEQDDGNALLVSTWLDDSYEGASISSFFRLDGFEDLYDAVWTNVGKRIEHGRPYRLRVAFDGMLYCAWVDDELVIYRRLDDVHHRQRALKVNRVGILANWEWGTDTGSTIRRFTVSGSAEDGAAR